MLATVRSLAGWCGLVLLAGLALAFPAGASDADAPSPGSPVHHVLQPGESPAEVARRYGVSQDLLRAANPDGQAEAGAIWTVPAPDPGWALHRVTRGQTLWAVCRLYGLRLEELKELNGLQDDRLLVGQALFVPVDPARIAADSLAADPSTSAVEAESPAGPTEVLAESRAGTPDGAGGPLGAPLLSGWVEVRLADGRLGWAPGAAMLVPSLQPLPPDQVVATARRFIGTPYRWGGESPNGVDCSGFVQEVFRLSGHPLRRTADLQFEDTVEVPREAMQPGDLIFFSTTEPGPSHVGICSGTDTFLHASSSQGVIQSNLQEEYYAQRFLSVRRLPAWSTAVPEKETQGVGAAGN